MAHIGHYEHREITCPGCPGISRLASMIGVTERTENLVIAKISPTMGFANPKGCHGPVIWVRACLLADPAQASREHRFAREGGLQRLRCSWTESPRTTTPKGSRWAADMQPHLLPCMSALAHAHTYYILTPTRQVRTRRPEQMTGSHNLPRSAGFA